MALNKEEMKEALKEAIKEWMDDKFIIFGKMSLMAIGAALFGALVYFLAWANGYHKLQAQ